MKVRNLILGAAAALMAFASCQKPDQTLDSPKITLDKENMTFEAEAGEQTLAITATRDWMVECNEDWVIVSPDNGKYSNEPQVVTVSVLENKGMDRTVDIKFTIGMASKFLTVTQAGPGGSAEQLILYSNDFDKEVAEKKYGSSGESWPYLDQFDGWQNQTGTGVAKVEYAYSGMSARSNSTSNSNYSDYEGSGDNNMFFGSNAYLATKNIALGGKTDLILSFGTEKYSQSNGSVFTNSEFHIYLSQDGTKWVELKDYVFAGGSTEGRWNLASATFSVPSSTENLSICMKTDVASSYRMDDLKLEVASEKGTAVDFSNAVEMDFTAGGDNGGNQGGTTPPENIKDVTVAEFNAAAVSTTDWYRLEGTVGGPINATYGNFDIIDETGEVYVYGISNWSDYKSQVEEGGTVVVVGQRGDYNGKIEVLEGYIESYDGSTAGGDNGGNNNGGSDGEKLTVAQFLDKEEGNTYYELTGKITDLFNTTYGNFTLVDDSGSVLVYGLTATKVESNDKSFSTLGLKEGDTVTLMGTRDSYNGTAQVGGPAYYISHVAGDGGGNGGDDNPPAGEPGEYDPQGITWTLGSSAYDNTSGQTAQTGTVNGVEVSNLLKLGTGSKVGDATLHIPAGTKKVGAYIVAWKGKNETNLKFSVAGTEVVSMTPKANTGASGNPPYTITVTDEDYYEIEVNTDSAMDVKVETTDPSQGRVILIGLKAIN